MEKIVTKFFIKKTIQYKKNPRYVAEKSNFEYAFKISDRSVKICSSHVPSHLKKSGFEKNAFKALNTVKLENLDIFSALHLLVSFLRP